MSLLLDILSGFFLLSGSFLCITGAIGLLRLPDIFCRLHAASLNETLGTPLILLGLILQIGLTLTSAKLVLVALFILATNPTATHAMSRAALHSGARPLLDEKAQEESSSKS
jgi:multicomponent Na+:H+ antiporter subunit G